MGRKNLPSDKYDQEFTELIALYEAMKAENKQIYLDGDQLADIADYYATILKFGEAQQVITYGLQLHPGNTDLLVEQAYLYLDKQQLQKATEVAESITETYATEVKMLKAELLLNKGKLDDAESLLNTIEDQDNLDTIVDVVYLYTDMGYAEKALPWLEKGIDQYGGEEEFLAATADCYSTSLDLLEEAVVFYNKLIDKNPYNAYYWVGLAKTYFSLQEYGKAIDACDFAFAADSNYGEIHTVKAHCLLHLQREDEAIEEYYLAMECKDLSPEVYYTCIGLAYTNKEDWKQAYNSYEKALLYTDENSAALFSDLAYCLCKMGDFEKAHQACAQAKIRAVVENNFEFYLVDGYIYMAEGNIEMGKERWEIALLQSPTAETWYQVATYSIEYRLMEDALLCFEKVKELDPDFNGIDEQLASLYLILKDKDNFLKHNELSKHPFNYDELYQTLESIGSHIDEENRELLDELKITLRSMQKEDDKEIDS